MNTRAMTSDDVMLRSAARRMAWQIAAASAVVVLLAVLGTLILGPLVHHARVPALATGPRTRDEDDAVLFTTLLIAGVLGVLIAGIVGFVAARRAVAPVGQALALQRRFVADASHELRTPLTVLQTRAQLLARRLSADDPARPTVDLLVADARVLGEIVEELLESAQLTADPRHGELVDLSDLVTNVASSMGVLAEQTGVRLVTEITGPAVVLGSRTALRRALSALVDNALGHAGTTVRLGAATVDDRVRLWVQDDGEGPGENDLTLLTERFSRGTRRSTGPGGRRFGLGLALVDEVARAHRGTFHLRAAPTGGAIAVLELPDGETQTERKSNA